MEDNVGNVEHLELLKSLTLLIFTLEKVVQTFEVATQELQEVIDLKYIR